MKPTSKHLLRVFVLLIIAACILICLMVIYEGNTLRKMNEYGIDNLEILHYNDSLITDYFNIVTTKMPFPGPRIKFNPVKQIKGDPVGQFHCIEKPIVRADIRLMNDIMCDHKPQYLPDFKNPCFRKAKNDFQCLPYFHVLGVDKCGTTDLSFRITRHPSILENEGILNKETIFWTCRRRGVRFLFTWMAMESFSDYPKYFTNASKKILLAYKESKEQLITGDETPMDFWDFRGWQQDQQNQGLSEPVFLTPHAMRHVYRDPKFILIFRNPVDRLYSDYVFLKYGLSPREFDVDAKKAIAIMEDCLQKYSTRQCFFSEHIYQILPARITLGCYSIFLREWLNVFDRSNFLILRTEDYHQNRKIVLRRVFTFLDVRELSEAEMFKLDSAEVQYQTKKKKKIADMFIETRALLTNFYSICNEDLANLLEDERFLWS